MTKKQADWNKRGSRHLTAGRLAWRAMGAMLLSCGWFAGAGAVGQTPPRAERSAEAPKSIGRQVDQLLRQLQRGSAQQRQQAEEDLIRLGPDALPYLPVVDPDLPADFRVRLRRITERLERQAAEAVWSAKTVTLQGEYRWPELVEAIADQTGNRLRLVDAPAGAVSLDLRDEPFWPVLDKLLDDAGLDIDELAGEAGVLVIRRRASRSTPRAKNAAYAGPLRFEPTSVDLARDLIGPAPAAARIRLAATWEPRLKPIAVSFPFAAFSARDDAGNTYAAQNPQAFPSFPVHPGVSAVEVAVAFDAPPRAATKLEQIRGECHVLSTGDFVEFGFGDLTKPGKQRKAGVEVEFLGSRKNGDVWEVQVKVTYDEAFTALDSHRGWIQDNPVFLKDSQGKKLESLGLQLTSQGRRSFGLAYLFDLSEDPSAYELHYATPAELLTRKVSFQLGEIRLP